MYRKPNFRPHYLHFSSNHPPQHKNSIYTCEMYRILCLSSHESTFFDAMRNVVKFLAVSGYPEHSHHAAVFSVDKRFSALQKFSALSEKRRRAASPSRPVRQSVLRLLVPYSDQIASLKIKKLFVQSFKDLKMQVAWKVRRNSMRILYRYNFI